MSRERVLEVALGVVDAEGLGALSMRRVAAELGVEAMALYRYAPSKDSLLDGLVEMLFIELHEALAAHSPDAGLRGIEGAVEVTGWREELHRIAREKYRIALEHPHVIPLVATRLLGVPLAQHSEAYLLDQERSLELFALAGLNEKRAQTAYRASNSWVLGFILTELRPMVDNPDEPDPAFRLGLHRLSAQTLPRLRAGTPALAVRAGEKMLIDGLDALIDQFAPEAD
ncbi:TetR/AcrR family transcriptional regulator [Actinacidiphila alni]|uniref:TetR/AcrR family transcriptional regulator n=1 Tax=Actinacidiphila alni TaxID=380248 RepID=UPI0033CD5E39